MDYKDVYKLWLNSSFLQENHKEELENIFNETEIKDRFYKYLDFGTGGIRGLTGMGTNRINIYTVSRATEGLANYLINKFDKEDISVAIAYDCRNQSLEFAKKASEVLCGHGIKIYIFNEIMPTPMLSYAVRYLKCKAGIVITASHNSKEYNGYKVYNYNGNQITDSEAEEIGDYIKKVENLDEIKYMNEKMAKEKNIYSFIPIRVLNSYFQQVKELSLRKNIIKENGGDLKVIFTPLHGTGNVPVRRALCELGYDNVLVVKEQEKADGDFPTVKYPNPEFEEVFHIALEKAKKEKADIIIGTDPDCDRIGIMIKYNNKYIALNGNELGILLTNYILMSLSELGKMPPKPVLLKTIVTTDMVKKICEDYAVKVEEVLTGFKYIGERIEKINSNGNKNFIFGFEESYGYLFGDFVRDKDGIISAAIICEMALYYKTKNKNLCDVINELYDKYGYYKEKLIYMELEGMDGANKIEKIMSGLREYNSKDIFGYKIIKKIDYKTGIKKDMTGKEESISLPKSNVLKLYLDNNTSFVIRPSGTEPKIKIYLSAVDNELDISMLKLNNLEKNVKNIINEFLN